MKTIAKAVTRHSALDAYGKTYYTEDKLIAGECYLVHNGELKHMLLPQHIVEGTTEVCPSPEAYEKMSENEKSA